MKNRCILKSIFTITLTLILILASLPATVLADTETVTAEYTAKLTFSDSGITETSAGAGYEIDGTTLTITAAGTYDLTGSCSEGAVIVDKSLSGVVLMLDGLTLASSSTAPIIVKKQCSDVNIHLVDGTTSTITNNEDPANEESTDTEVADAFEGACIKVKTDSAVTFCGGGDLVCTANTKNGIKGGTNASLTFNATGTITVNGNYRGYATSAGAVNNGIASDGSLTFNAGTYVVAAANDGIKAVPDADDTTSAGDLTVNGGTFDIDVDGDGLQAEHNLTISAGTFDIRTMSGYNDSNYDEDTMSCKGIKASGDREDIENTISITGGDFTMNTVDDAVHSDMYATVTGGSFYIQTGDDGMHADTSLVLGTSGGYERDPDVYIATSYEGLEAGTVYVYSGRHYVYATDDGVNAAGGSSSGTEPGQGGGNTFNPGGGGPGSGGGPGQQASSTSGSSDYNLYIYGGELFVNCLGDGLDSNGGLYLYGGKTSVFSQASGGDNSPCDTDGSWVISGGTLFAAGTNQMNETPSNSQKYYTSTTSRNANTKLSVSYGGSVKYSCTLPRKINYLLYSDPSMTSTSCSVSTGSLTSCASSAWRSSWEHSWDSGSTADGVTTYTCATCGATERQTEAVSATVSACDHTVEVEETSTVTGYTATFSVSNASVNIYYTKDYTAADETGVTTALARDGDTGEIDVSGSGQINFTIVPDDGYEVADVSVSGSYKNLKGPDDTGIENTYRITKVASDLTITIDVTESETTVSGIKVTGASGSFNDQIKLNFYMELQGDYELPDGAYVELTGSNCTGTVTTTFADAAVTDDSGNISSYKFSIPLVAKEANDTITATAYDSDGNQLVLLNSNDESGYGFEMTLMTYLDWLASNGSTDDFKALGTAAADYCKAAQIYFDYNADGLTLSDNLDSVTASDLIGYCAVESGTLPTGVTMEGVSAMVEADNTLRVYLVISETAGDISYLIDTDTTTLKTRTTDGATYLALDEGVYSNDLQTSHDYHIGDYTLTASVLTYARLCILSDEENTQNLGKALYLYNQAAVNCF